jgi:hypothetical protein
MIKKVLLAIIVIATLILMSSYKRTEAPISEKSDPKAQLNTDFAAWVWDSPTTYKEESLRKMFKIAQENKINILYVRVDDYIHMYINNDISDIEKMDAAVKTFITVAKEYGIRVEALGGSTGWADPEEATYPGILFDAVIKYNAANPDAKFTGLQFDVESYNSDFYKKSKLKALTNYLNFVQNMANKRVEAGNDFNLGFAVPFWLDDENKNGVTLDWKTQGIKPTVYHMFDILNRIEDSYIVIMDYRNYAQGTDGSIENAKNEMDYASRYTPNVKVVIGQETTQVAPAKITFHGLSKEVFYREVAKILNVYGTDHVFGGMAVHHLESFIDL